MFSYGRESRSRKVFIQMTHILLATPCSSNQFCGDYVRSIAQMPIAMHNAGIKLDIAIETRTSDIARARNMLARQFLDGPYTHLLFVDADQGWRPEDVIRMVSHGLPLVAGAVPKKDESARGEAAYVGNFEATGDDKPYLIKATHAGTGFMLIRRDVFETMTALGVVPSYNSPTGENEEAYFLHGVRGRDLVSEDYAFCEHYRETGGAVWIDTLCELTHVGQKRFALPSLFAEMKGIAA